MVCGCNKAQTQLNQPTGLISIDNRLPLDSLIAEYQQGRRLSPSSVLSPISLQPQTLGAVTDTMVGTAGGVLIALGLLILIAAMMGKKK